MMHLLSRTYYMALFLFNASAPTEIYTLSLHDALPISDLAWARTLGWRTSLAQRWPGIAGASRLRVEGPLPCALLLQDRKSTRLNSSHVEISYAVFCLKKKNKTILFNVRKRSKNTIRYK